LLSVFYHLFFVILTNDQYFGFSGRRYANAQYK
jgi:hypothetical protein